MNAFHRWRLRSGFRVDHSADRKLVLLSAGRSHQGNRERNEDRFLERTDLGLFAVADGMGGHQDGEKAAEAVIDSLTSARPASVANVRASIEGANAVIYAGAGHGRTCGSTVVSLLIDGSGFNCLWAGDSELWLARGGELRKLTRDHSVVEDLVSSGLIEASQRNTYPHRHLITRAVGVAPSIELEGISGPVFARDVFLLCSDGLTKPVRREDLEALTSDGELDDLADQLLAAALWRGAQDNVTLLLVRVLRHSG